MTVHVRFAETFPLRKSEWLLATVMSGCGVMTLMYPTMFVNSSALRAMLAYFEQPVWGWAMTIVGLLGWIALFRNGGWKRSPAVRAVCASIRGVIWLQMFFALSQLSAPGWGLIFFPAFVVMEFINAGQAAQDARKKTV